MVRVFFGTASIVLLGAAVAYWVTRPVTVNSAEYVGLTGNAKNGELVFWASGCASCHAAPGKSESDQLVLAGGQEFASPFGTFLAPNISPDQKEGIGGWTLVQFANAIQKGVSPNGSHLYPALPYASYNKMAPQDVADLKAYIDTLPASAQPSKPHVLSFPFNVRLLLGVWKRLFVTNDWHVEGDLSPQEERGRYIAEALAHCTECHTPRNALGGLDRAKWLGGAPTPDGKGRTPNITSAKLNWSQADIVEYLTSGLTPSYDSVGGHMAHVVENMAHLPESDRQAVASYLARVSPVE